MNIRKRRSDRSGRVRLFSPGRPPVAGREGAARRFWAAIGRRARRVKMLWSVSVSRMVAVGTRWFRKAGGMPPSMFGLMAKPLSVVGISRLRSGRRSRSFAFRATPCRRSLAGSGEWHRQPPPEAAASRIVRRQQQWHRRARCSPPKAERACRRNAAIKNAYVEERLAGASLWLERASCSWSGTCPGKSRRHPDHGSDRRWANAWSPEQIALSPAGGLRGRRDHAHQP